MLQMQFVFVLTCKPCRLIHDKAVLNIVSIFEIMTTKNNGMNDLSEQKYLMSFLRHPISNRYPSQTVSLFDVYQLIHGPAYERVTNELRALKTEDEQRQYKQQKLDFILPAGIFSYANDKSLVKESGLLCVDLDDIDDVEALKQRLLADKLFETMMLFRSPCNAGLKWLLRIDLTKCDYRQWFTGIRNYLMATYGLTAEQVDSTSINISRACWLCHDEHVYLRTDLIESFCI